MSHAFTDGRALEGKQVMTFPLEGGMDLITNKLTVSPGTLQECLNYEVDVKPGYTQLQGLVEYGLVDFHIPYFVKSLNIRIGVDDEIKIFPGGEYTTSTGARIKVLYVEKLEDGVEYDLYSSIVRVISGELSTYFNINVTGSLTYNANIVTQTESVFRMSRDRLDRIISNFSVDFPENEVPGIGPLNSIFFLDDTMYAIRDEYPTTVITLRGAEEQLLYETINEDDNIRVYMIQDAGAPGPPELKFYAKVLDISQPVPGKVGQLTIEYLHLSDRIKYDTLDPSDRLSTYKEVQKFINISQNEGVKTPVWHARLDTADLVATGADNVYADFDTDLLIRGLTGEGTTVSYEEFDSSRGILWKESTKINRNRPGYWTPVDLGQELQFDTGTTKPLTALNRTFVDDDAEILVTGEYSSEIQEGNWRDKENVQELGAPESWAYRGLAFGSTSNLNRWRQYGPLIVRDFGIKLPTHTVVTGITATVRMTAYMSTPDPTDVEIRDGSVEIVAGGVSSNKANLNALTINTAGAETFVEVEYGGDNDLWGLPGIPKEILESEEFAFRISPEAYVTDFESFVTFAVSHVTIKVHYQDGTEKVHFYDSSGTTNVATADVVNFARKKGAWDTNDAEGVISLYNIEELSGPIEAGLEIRTQTGGGGDLIGNVVSLPSPVSLPTSASLRAMDSKILTIRSNFFSDVEGEAVYGVTGAGPAFFYDGRYFSYIRIPELSEDKDIPRHVWNNQLHLTLGYPSGQVLISAPGQPLNFEAGESSGAVEVGFGDKITGFWPIAGNALGVFCESSTYALTGSSAASFLGQPISSESGAIEYTVSAVGQPLYCDTQGISNINTTDRFGDFEWGRITRFISPWLRGRLQEYGVNNERKPIFALPIKNKNQYRLFFEDGYIMTLSIVDVQGNAVPMTTLAHYDTNDFSSKYVPVCGISEVLSNGKEVSAIGTEDGKIYILDAGPGITDAEGHRSFDSSITLNPFNGNATPFTMKYNQVYIHGVVPQPVELSVTAGVNYLVPEPSAFEDQKTFGYEDEYMDVSRLDIPAMCGAHTPSLTDGYSIKISSVSDIIPPHTLQAITLRPVITSDKTSTPRSTD